LGTENKKQKGKLKRKNLFFLIFSCLPIPFPFLHLLFFPLSFLFLFDSFVPFFSLLSLFFFQMGAVMQTNPEKLRRILGRVFFSFLMAKCPDQRISVILGLLGSMEDGPLNQIIWRNEPYSQNKAL